MSVPEVLSGLETMVETKSAITPSTDEQLSSETVAENYVPINRPTKVSPKHVMYYSQLPVFDEKSINMNNYRTFTVQLCMDLDPKEMVAVTGNTITLGEWQVERAVPLRPFGHMQWSVNVPLHAKEDVKYRYFTYILDAHGRRLVRKWESELQPRLMKRQQVNAKPGVNASTVDRFGEIEKGEVALHRGWLTNETVVQFKFERDQMFKVSKMDEFDPRFLRIEVEALHEATSSVTPPEEDGLRVEVTKLKYNDSELRCQEPAGVEYKPGDVIIFHLTVPHILKYAYALNFRSTQKEKNEAPIGRVLIKPEQLKGSAGELELKVCAVKEGSVVGDGDGAGKELAVLTLPYLVVKPMPQSLMDFRTSYADYWPESWPNLDMGHRGMGRSFISEAPEVPENTIASFLRAHELHSDMIELDVQLTADGVPIIWHDFSMKTAQNLVNVSSPEDLSEVFIKDVTYNQLKELRVFAIIDNKVTEYPSHNAEKRASYRFFPRLVDVLKTLPAELGIDIEIKWPQLKASGIVEAEQTIDKNFYVDRILQDVLHNGCGRPIIFSSFDADICCMLRLKQNLLPVMFLTIGETKKWEPFMDLRTRSFEQGVNFAQAFELIGTAPHAEDFVNENGGRLMQLAHNLDQVAVVWGDDCNSHNRVKYFGSLGAAAICYDRVDLNMAKEKKMGFFNTMRSKKLFEGQCKSVQGNINLRRQEI